MSQRNPLNDRYAGDGPKGQTRKSASKAKPAHEAASTVHVEARPTNAKERKAARKHQEALEKRKQEEHLKKLEEREKAERIARGETVAEKKKSPLSFLKKPIAEAAQPLPKSEQKKIEAERKAKEAEKKQQAAKTPKVLPKDMPRYKKLRRVYWVMMGFGVLCIILSILFQMAFGANTSFNWVWEVAMGAAYVCVIGAIVLDAWKVRPLTKKAIQGTDGHKSPKQIKHEQEALEAAARIEEAKKARRAKRNPLRKLPSRKPAVEAASEDGQQALATDNLAEKDAE